jgi:hypothetical protein
MLIDYHVHTAMSDARGEFQNCVKIGRRSAKKKMGEAIAEKG